MDRKAQIAFEYLVILGLTFLMILASSYVFYNYSKSTTIDIVKNQVSGLGNKIMANAESIYSLGAGSLVRIEVVLPEEIKYIYVDPDETLVIVITTPEGESETLFFSDFDIEGNVAIPHPDDVTKGNLIGDVSSGRTEIEIRSEGSYVSIGVV